MNPTTSDQLTDPSDAQVTDSTQINSAAPIVVINSNLDFISNMPAEVLIDIFKSSYIPIEDRTPSFDNCIEPWSKLYRHYQRINSYRDVVLKDARSLQLFLRSIGQDSIVQEADMSNKLANLGSLVRVLEIDLREEEEEEEAEEEQQAEVDQDSNEEKEKDDGEEEEEEVEVEDEEDEEDERGEEEKEFARPAELSRPLRGTASAAVAPSILDSQLHHFVGLRRLTLGGTATISATFFTTLFAVVPSLVALKIDNIGVDLDNLIESIPTAKHFKELHLNVDARGGMIACGGDGGPCGNSEGGPVMMRPFWPSSDHVGKLNALGDENGIQMSSTCFENYY